MNEDTNNDVAVIDNSAEIQTALEEIAKNQQNQTTTDQALLKELQKINKYNEAQQEADKQAKQEADTQAEIEAQEKEASDKEAAEQAEIDAETQAAKDQAVEEHQETVQEILVDIRSQLELQNEQLAVHTIWFGVVCGLLFVKILFDRIIRL